MSAPLRRRHLRALFRLVYTHARRTVDRRRGVSEIVRSDLRASDLLGARGGLLCVALAEDSTDPDPRHRPRCGAIAGLKRLT